MNPDDVSTEILNEEALDEVLAGEANEERLAILAEEELSSP